ncbi:pyridoxamine kinase [Desulfovibrio litoralis]|uniref:pyridoxal kinase n=1 Tax=Desulfovibrio litoralis DSM 11393 TaxID=1121455 RepID=A0A1M7TEY6_9BACT|nr:pyridoxamine kinase [Desulfovibrio litoralis]SHN69270.1 pyridoxine kinase [Desulfovibrio litoralis DSM 11393]
MFIPILNPEENVISRVAAIHDLSGFGRTSLTVVIPILASMGIQVCPLPTAVLSTHTAGFENFSFIDLTETMFASLKHWRSLNLKFEAVYSGFLGSADQVNAVAECFEHCLKQDGLALVDPVLGDNGVLDPTMTPEIVESMRWLVTKADIITPNFTEAALLLNEEYTENINENLLKNWLIRLTELGPRVAVITSTPLQNSVFNPRLKDNNQAHDFVFAYDKANKLGWKIPCKYVPAHYPGTGDTFASVLLGSLLQGDNLPLAIERAVQFVGLGIRATFGHGTPPRDGIMLERVLHALSTPVTNSNYELF